MRIFEGCTRLMVLGVIATALAAMASLPAQAKPKGGYKIVAYVPGWIDLDRFSETIDYAKLTHINIAFENPVNDEGDLSFNPRNDKLIGKAHAAKVKALISIGGGAASGDKTLLARYFSLFTPQKRAAFSAKLADYVVAHKLDGIDVDIEGPSINADYNGFVVELSKAIKAKRKLLTAALSQGYGGTKVTNEALACYDYVNVMAYDGAGYWNPNAPGQHSSLQFAKDNAQYWVKRGLKPERAVLGVPFYGYGFGEAFKQRDYPYKTVVEMFPGAENADEAGNTVYYNGIPTIKAKAQYVVDEQLGGMMIWSLDYDVPGDKSLLNAMYNTLNAKP